MLLAESLLGSSATEANYIEDVFSTWLYTGTGSTQTINNGIDLAGKGGLVWVKGRSGTFGTGFHLLQDSARGFGNSTALSSNSTDAQYSSGGIIQSVSGSGFTTGASGLSNASSTEYVSWTFRKQPKFFDVVTYTGNGANRTIAHNLGSVPGCIMVKRTDTTGDWQVYHRSLANTQYLVLNSTAAAATGATRWNSTTPTDTVFSLGTDATVNANGGTYVAYLFAHNAGGFGATGTDNVISCGSFTTDSSGNAPPVTLGYEPQWVLHRAFTSTDNSRIYDSMRGMSLTDSNVLLPNTSWEEISVGSTQLVPTATGFNVVNIATNRTYIYIAIRRGPMRTPTSGTSVFGPQLYTGNGSASRTLTNSVAFPPDWMIVKTRSNSGSGDDTVGQTRLTGLPGIFLNSTNAEIGSGFYPDYFWQIPDQQSFYLGVNGRVNASAASFVNWSFRRAPGFFDVVCYTGDQTVNDVNHNLGVVPELIIGKRRNSTGDWAVYSSTFNGGVNPHQYVLYLNQTAALAGAGSFFLFDQPTATRFRPTTVFDTNTGTYVAYLFASCPGVSKVGSYTGTGATQTINCGFAAGARFVLIKRTDSTGDWYVWDSARGIVAANDPYLRLNSTAAEVTNTDWVDPAASGFELSNAAGNNANINGASYIFLAVS